MLVFFSDGTIAMGCVMKNHDQGIFYSATNRVVMDVDPTVAEAFAIRWDLSIAKDFKLQNILLFSDAINVVDCINKLSVVATIELYVVDCMTLVKQLV